MDRAAYDLEYAARSLFRRCVQCPATPPACPNCGPNSRCELVSGSCNACASTTCIPISSGSSSSGSGSPSSGSSPIGPIVGGVVGGIVLVAAAVFLIYWFWIRPRKQRYQEDEWQDENVGVEKDGMNQFNVGTVQDPRRASTHTVGSVASTVLTRASNVIQIAYIPGVTNRSMHSSPELVPPVPPIPAASAGPSTVNSPQADQHFFGIEDLRQSSYSNLSTTTRGSVASTTYRNDAVVNPMPAQAVTRMKPTAVSVKSSSKNTPNMSRSASPPIPTSAYATSGSAGSSSNPTRQPTLNTKSSIVGKFAQPKSITVTRKGSTTLRPFKQGFAELDGASSRSVSPLSSQRNFGAAAASPQYSHHSSTFRDQSSSDEEYDEVHELAGQGLMVRDHRRSNNNVHEAPTSPLSVPSYSRSPELGGPSSNVHKRNSSLGKVIEEATKRAAQTHVVDYVNHEPERSPFGDENAATTP